MLTLWMTQRLIQPTRQLDQQRILLKSPCLQLLSMARSPAGRVVSSNPMRNYMLPTSYPLNRNCHQKDCQSTMIISAHQRLNVNVNDIHRYFRSTSSSFVPWGGSSNQKKKKKRPSKPQASATAGRIVLQQSTKKKNNKSKMCMGCGTEVTFDSGGQEQKMLAGHVAVDAVDGQSKAKAKKSRYMDPTDPLQTGNGNFLCDRCKALNNNNFWKAYDALRDVSPQVFMEQLKYIVGRRRFGLCLAVVDATDPEHSLIRNLRQAIGSTPCMLILNKIDLLPRMSDRDRRYLQHRVERASTRFVLGCHVVSAKTGVGLIDLAEEILLKLGGRDVFVVGSANVGKSSLVKRLSMLIADAVYFKGTAKQATKRRQATHGLAVTGSHLPGTTLQAIRVPCFPSRAHALWDTPGIINNRAVQYHVFPTHLMEPLTRPGEFPIPTMENGLAFSLCGSAGKSILIEATWMDAAAAGHANDDEDKWHEPDNSAEDKSDKSSCVNTEGHGDGMTGVLARIDVLDTSSTGIYVAAYLHPSLRIRIVPTTIAPDRAIIPISHIEQIKEKIHRATGHRETGLKDEYSIPLKPFCSPDRPNGAFIPGDAEMEYDEYSMDICFASLGWVSFLDREKYTVVPHCVEGSVFSKRRGMYPINLHSWLKNHEKNTIVAEKSPKDSVVGLDKETKRRLQDAARRGRHQQGRDDSDDEWHDDDEVY